MLLFLFLFLLIQYRPQTPSNSPQIAHAATRLCECENHILESPQHCQAPHQPALAQISQPHFPILSGDSLLTQPLTSAHSTLPYILDNSDPNSDPFSVTLRHTP